MAWEARAVVVLSMTGAPTVERFYRSMTLVSVVAAARGAATLLELKSPKHAPCLVHEAAFCHQVSGAVSWCDNLSLT
jgi:hypothetical protein